MIRIGLPASRGRTYWKPQCRGLKHEQVLRLPASRGRTYWKPEVLLQRI
jgi:hypothetical protein